MIVTIIIKMYALTMNVLFRKLQESPKYKKHQPKAWKVYNQIQEEKRKKREEAELKAKAKEEAIAK